MEERERMLDTIMAMQEFNIKKDKQIEELEQENQALKDRWQKLKDWVNARYNDYRFEGHIVSPETEELDAITNKMQELEQGDKDGTSNNQ